MNGVDFKGGVLKERVVIELAGPDCRSFLQNLLTCDVGSLQKYEMAYGALLTPQGKIFSDLFVQYVGYEELGDFFIDCSASQADELVERLKRYRLRAKVDLGINSLEYVQVFPAPLEEWEECGFDPRTPLIGCRGISTTVRSFFIPGTDHEYAEGYDAARIALGLADTDADLGSGEYFPHEANLDQLGGVSFTKGCYVGQEVVSRMEHRGTARNRILPVTLDGDAPPKGSEIRSGEKQIGTLLSSSGNRALALLRLDRLAESTEPLLTEGVTLHVLKPRWARYDVPRAEGDA